MNFSTLFRLRENLNLDRKTLVILRWIAIIGQFTAINLVYFYLKLDFSSLYPSIQLVHNVFPECDVTNALQGMLGKSSHPMKLKR